MAQEGPGLWSDAVNVVDSAQKVIARDLKSVRKSTEVVERRGPFAGFEMRHSGRLQAGSCRKIGLTQSSELSEFLKTNFKL